MELTLNMRECYHILLTDFYVVTKFILQTIDDLTFSPIDFDSECSYFNIDFRKNSYPM